jgi:hypothetical protein
MLKPNDKISNKTTRLHPTIVSKIRETLVHDYEREIFYEKKKWGLPILSGSWKSNGQ